MRLIPIIIFIIVVINILRRIAEFNRNRPKTDGDWTEWNAGSSDPANTAEVPRPRPTPSDRVREILEQLAQGEASPPATAPPVPPPLPAPAPPPLPAPRPAYAAPVTRRYLTEDTATPPAPAPVRASIEEAAPAAPRLPSTDAVYRESLRKAFPPAMAIIRETRSQGRPPFAVRLRGRHSLRQAIVLAEVLGPPRAFDL